MIPQKDKYYYHIPFGHDVRFTVQPNIMKTDKSLIEDYNSIQRKCIASNEHDLVFFQKYTQSNCQLDVFVLETIKLCKCSLFWMPRFNDTKICRLLSKVLCTYKVEQKVHDANLTAKCLPACNSITYNAEISMSKLDNRAILKILNRFYNAGQTDSVDMALIGISFKNQQYFFMRRSELYGRYNFIAGCGGILSLFMGVSLLSVVEILYSATLRLYLRRKNREAIPLENANNDEK